MGRRIAIGLATLLALLAWTGLVAVGAREGWGRPLPAARGDTAGFLKWAQGRYAAQSRGDFAIVLLDHGQVAGGWYGSHGRPVDGQSLFQVASMSKWVTAWGVMTLAQQGRIDLDAPVSRYLKRWRLPPSRFDNDQVTARRLLSHTAGLTDGLGFMGFPPGRTPPSLEQELAGPRDAMPGARGLIAVGARPGSDWRYSGGGYLILQLLIEDVTGEPFDAYMRRAVLRPLGMSGSTFTDPDPARLADNFDAGGARIPYARYTALGAASLFTSTQDMTRFLQAQSPGPGGEPAGRGVLSPASLREMGRPHGFLHGLPVWGLGESLYAPNGAGGFVIGHDGGNAPAINTTARLDPATGDGIIVFENGDPLLARRIGGEWLFWRTGVVGLDTLVMFEARKLAILLAAGALAILAAGAILIARSGRRLAS